ncbi:MAG: hypothetical protein KGP28_04510 [Bdellovibrionales bacterium]|nr:hypothetical protein [Bdellovibrionales bacterium]
MKNQRLLVLPLLLFLPQITSASVFTIPQFVEYKSWAVGIEPEATLSSSARGSGQGVAFNAKFTYGISPLSNLQIGLGPGSGNRTFRFGGTYSFDFIPDLSGQVGAGLATQAYYFNLRDQSGRTEILAYPYVHKRFTSSSGLEFDPFIAMPYGLAFVNGNYDSLWQLALGSFFKTSEHIGLNTELGLGLKNADTYLCFGISYQD